MERRRLAVVLAGLVLVGGAVTALRLTGATPGEAAPPPPPPPIPTVIKSYTALGVVAPTHGGSPAPPTHLTLTPGPHRLLADWTAAAGATGYEVSWGTGGSSNNTRLVAEPDAELDGLVVGQRTEVRVRSVDSYGQRSATATATGVAQPDGPPGADDALVDHFDGTQVPDPKLWRLASANCAQAVRGAAPDGDRLVILSACGRTAAVLRARAPFRLDPAAPAGELGRFTIDTDAPGEGGELDIDLVPGPADMVDGSTNDPIATAPPDTATVDTYLPPGTIRVRIGADILSDTGHAAGIVQITAGTGTPLVAPVVRTPAALPAPRLGVSVRWDVVLRTDGIEVLRDGVLVADGNAVPGWTSATALVEFNGLSSGQLRADVNMIGFGGAPTSAPPVAAGPSLHMDAFVAIAPGASGSAITSTDTGPDSAQLRFTVLVTANSQNAVLTEAGAGPKFLVAIGDQVFTSTPAVPGEPLLANVRYPLVARLPAGVLHGRDQEIGLSMDVPSTYPGSADLVQTDLEMVPGPDTRPATSTDVSAGVAVVAAPAQLATLSAQVLNANGDPAPAGTALPRGRAVLEVQMDAVAGQRAAAVLAGSAGFKVWLDNTELVAVPTAMDGPGIAGTWRIAFDAGQATPGQHVIDVRAYGARQGTAFTETFVSFALK